MKRLISLFLSVFVLTFPVNAYAQISGPQWQIGGTAQGPVGKVNCASGCTYSGGLFTIPAGAGGVTSVTGSNGIASSGGATPNITPTYGTLANTICQGNDVRLSPTPVSPGSILVESAGGVYVEGPVCALNTLALGAGAATYTCGTVPNAALTNSNITINGTGGISGCGSTSLGGTCSLSISTGTFGQAMAVTGYAVNAVAGGGTGYLVSSNTANSVPTATSFLVSPVATTLRVLRCSFATGPGVGQTETLTVYKSTDNGATWAATTSTCQASGATNNQACNDTSHAVSFAAGDQLAFQAVQSAGSVGAGIACTAGLQN